MNKKQVGIAVAATAVVGGIVGYFWYKRKKNKTTESVKEEEVKPSVDMETLHNTVMDEFLSYLVPEDKDKYIKSYMGLEELFAKHSAKATQGRKEDITAFGTFLTYMMKRKCDLAKELDGTKIDRYLDDVKIIAATVYMINDHFDSDRDRHQANIYAVNLTKIHNLGFENKDSLKVANL